MNKTDFQYYAFISYSRKNSKAASYLHKQLEHFRVPVKYVAEENRPNGKFLRPVFRDRRDLEAGEGSFTAHIKTAVEKSRYLIVLCSPESAASHWVNEEIKYFLATHNNDYNAIVPVILNGEPGSGGGAECLPEVLRVEEIIMRNLPSMIPDDGDDEKTGWENGVIQAMSYMLKVNREKIKATVDAEKVRQAKIYAVIGIAATIVFALLTAWAIHAERQATANEQRAIAGEKLAKENEAKAKEQAEVAKESLTFLAGIFQSTDPVQQGNKDLKVLDAIRSKIPEIKVLKKWQVRATISHDIARVFHSLGEYPQALELLNEAHKLNLENNAAPEEIATSYNNIGLVYSDQGNYAKALEYSKKSLAIRLKVLEPDHPDVALSYNNIGSVYFNQGNYAKALEYSKKALDIKLKVLGPDHPDVAISYNNIGFIYYSQGNYAKALEYYNKALAIDLKVSGPDHPDVATSYHNIGLVYHNQGNYAKALEYFNKSLAIQLKVLGPDHPSVAASYNNIGSVYAKQGNYAKALEYYNKALAIDLKVSGPDHPSVATSYHNIGSVYFNQWNYAKALEYYNKSLVIQLKVLGPDHPSVATSYHNIGTVYFNQWNYAKALEYYKKALDIAGKSLGEQHPNTKIILKSFEMTKEELKNFEIIKEKLKNEKQ